MSDWNHLIPFALAKAGSQFVLATLIQVEGSSYRPTGARLIIAQDGDFGGLLSGGCLEEGIATMAKGIFLSGQRRMIQIDTRPHFGCAGILHILLEPVSREFIQQISSRMATRKTFHLSSSLCEGTIISPATCVGFLEKVSPTKRLIAIGWTEDMEPLLEMGAILGWELHRIVRDKRLLDEIHPLAGETISLCEPADFAQAYIPDESTAVMIMSHHLATDLAYLKHAFNQPYAYIGLLGSKRRKETLLGELGEYGMLEHTPFLDRFHAPAGLSIGNDHPSEIALSIAAQIQQEFRRIECAGEQSNVIPLPNAISA